MWVGESLQNQLHALCGLNLRSMKLTNIAMIRILVWSMLQHSNKLWVKTIKEIYYHDQISFLYNNSIGSHTWRAILMAKKELIDGFQPMGTDCFDLRIENVEECCVMKSLLWTMQALNLRSMTYGFQLYVFVCLFLFFHFLLFYNIIFK